MDFYCTSEFRKTFRNFLKKPKQKLFSIKEEIPKVITPYNLEQSEWDWAHRIVKSKRFSTFKVRIPNNKKGLGKRAGFRLHFAYSNERDSIIFFGLLDKKTQKEQFSDAEYKALLEVLQKEYDTNELFPVELSPSNLEILAKEN